MTTIDPVRHASSRFYAALSEMATGDAEVGVEEGEVTLAGERIPIKHRVTNIYRREGGSWKREGKMGRRRVRLTGVRFGLLLALVWGGMLPALVGAAGATGVCNTASGSTTCTFEYTGAEQTWTVPGGVTQVTLGVFGAQGGNESAAGGKGGRATATIAVTPGETLTIVAGGQGGSPFSGGDAGGGFNGGGNGGAPYNLPAPYYGSGGGGASDVRIGGADLAHRVIVAGGGGGAANVYGPNGPSFGGAGGGLTGGAGNSAYIPYASSGGAGGNQDGTSGSGQLGTGSNGVNSASTVFNGVGAGGGGGGYYGGAGGSPGTGGGGGSGFGPAGTVFETGVRSGDGQVLLTYTPPDSTPPTTTLALSPASPDGNSGWYVLQPTVTVGAVDNGGGSGVAETRCVLDPSSVPSSFDALPSTQCPYLGAGAAVADGMHTVYAASVDNAGNSEPSVQSVSFKVDTAPPTLSPSLADGTVFTVGTPAPTVSPNASDPAPLVGPGPASGIASASCSAVSTATIGTRSVSCTATDRAGNTTIVSRSYTVGYAFSGFFSPVDTGVLNVAKAGKAIPLKFRLTDASGAPITTLTTATISSVSLSCVSLSEGSDAIEEYAAGASGLQNLGDGYYQLNWKSPTNYAGSCRQLRLNLGEGSTASPVFHTAEFRFTK